jgi:dihydroorotate dehydrogenase electron transfer subunit
VTAGASSARLSAAGPSGPRIFARRSPALVTGNKTLGTLVWLTLDVPGWPAAGPGQFALLQAQDSCCFLGRPLSIAEQDGAQVSFLIAPIGPGTRELCSLSEGDTVWVLGPLGNGFDLDALTGGSGRLVIVGGGVGAAPFPLLLDALEAAGRSGTVGARRSEVLVLLGFRDAAQSAGAEPVVRAAAALNRRGGSCSVVIVTEDGSLGAAERVTAALQREARAGDHLAVCGPWAMTEAVAQMIAGVGRVESWFSLEAGIACGVGSCHGCVVPLADGSKARVCREGPVFTGEALFERGLLSAGAMGER